MMWMDPLSLFRDKAKCFRCHQLLSHPGKTQLFSVPVKKQKLPFPQIHPISPVLLLMPLSRLPLSLVRSLKNISECSYLEDTAL